MKNKWKKVIAAWLAFMMIATAFKFPITLKAADESPSFPLFEKAANGMGTITNVAMSGKEIKMEMNVAGNSVTLSLAFLRDGGIRLYDENEYNAMFAPAENEMAEVEIVSHTDKILKAKGKETDISIFLDYAVASWSLSVYKGAVDVPVYVLRASDLMMSYNSGERESVTLCGEIKDGEEFIGLGERFSGLVLNGKSYELWNKDCWSQGTDSYVNVPLMHSNKGYSIFFNSYYGATADIGEEATGRYSFAFGGPDMDLYIWTGTPLENLKSYANLTGTSTTIPKWATGYWSGGTSDQYWYAKNERNENGEVLYHSNLVLEEVLSKYQELGTIPSAVYAESAPKNNASMYTISDNYGVKILGWWHANTPWTKDLNQKFSVKYMKDMLDGASDIPAVKNENGTGYYEEGTNKWVHIDYTHSSAELLLRKNLGEKSNVWSKGLDGFMVDYGELIPVETSFANGKTGEEMHNLQAYYYNKTMKSAWDSQNPSDGYILFSRAGTAGSQQYAALFGGDQRSTFKGLNQAIQGGISAGASGFSIWGSDIGGHMKADYVAQTEELYLRWLGFATYSPLMRAHGQSMNDPWDYDTEEETSAQDAFQKYYWLRENMRNLIYSASVQANKDGTPMMQAMGLAFNEEGMFSIQDQYLFCNEILVAPVAEEGATSRSVTLPTGKWYDLLTGEKVQGNGTSITVSANQDETPAFLRSGAVVPMEVSSDTWKFSDAMTDENRTEILLVTPGEKGQARSSTWWKTETERIDFTSSSDGKTQIIKASEGAKPTILKVYDTTATHIYVDGVEVDELSKMPNEDEYGYFQDEEGQLFLAIPSAEWKEIKIKTEGIWDYEFQLDEPYENVDYLDKAFDVYHYEFKDNTKKSVEKVLGPIAPSTLKEGSTVEYFTTQYYGSYSQGYLKPTTTSSGMATLTYKHSQFVNFEAEYEMLTTYNIFGLAFGGEKGVFPVSLDEVADNDTGVILYMTKEGKVEVAGAINSSDKSHCAVTMYKNTTVNARFSGTSYVYTKESMTGKTIEPKENPGKNPDTFTVCIKVRDGWLKVWEKGQQDAYIKVQLTNAYQGGYVSLIANQTGHGAFKAFRIRSLDDETTYQMQFDEMSDVSEIDDTFTAYHIYHTDGFTRTWDLDGKFSSLVKDFDSYYFEDRYTAAKKVAIEKQWFTNKENAPKETYATSKYANDYMKPIRNKTNSSAERYSLLTLRSQKVSDFTAKLTYVTTYSEYGIMVAPARTVGKGSNGLKVYVNSNGQISITGMLDMSQIEWTGEGTPANTTYTVQSPKQEKYQSPDENPEQSYTLTVSIKDEWVMASVDGFEGELKVKLKDDFVGDHISLYANGYSQGGFDQFELTVDKEDVVTMAGRPGAYWNTTGSDAGYLQPNHQNNTNKDAKRFAFLSYEKDDVYDFETEVEIANNYTRYGVSVAPAGEKYTSTNGIGVYVESSGKIHILGAIDKEQYWVTGDATATATTGSGHVYTTTALDMPNISNEGSADTVYTLCVEHKNGIVTAYVKEFPDVKLSVPTTSAYQGGVLSLYSTGNNQGGFKSWKFNTYKRDTVVWEKSSHGENVSFVLRTDFLYKHVAAVVKYDAENYVYKDVISYGGIIADVREKAEGELWVFADTKDGDEYRGSWLSILFEVKGDYSSLISAETMVSDCNMNTRYAKNEHSFCGDVDGNYYVDVRDLVRLKKYSLDASTTINEINSKLHPAVDIYSEDNVFLLRKKLLR